jgi:hypothetical protein
MFSSLWRIISLCSDLILANVFMIILSHAINGEIEKPCFSKVMIIPLGLIMQPASLRKYNK